MTRITINFKKSYYTAAIGVEPDVHSSIHLATLYFDMAQVNRIKQRTLTGTPADPQQPSIS